MFTLSKTEEVLTAFMKNFPMATVLAEVRNDYVEGNNCSAAVLPVKTAPVVDANIKDGNNNIGGSSGAIKTDTGPKNTGGADATGSLKRKNVFAARQEKVDKERKNPFDVRKEEGDRVAKQPKPTEKADMAD